MKNVSILHSISARIQNQCQKNGLTVEEFIGAIQKIDDNISRETIKSWYYKNVLPRDKRLNLLCDVLDCDSDYLLGRREETTHDRAFIRKETGLDEDAIIQLQNAKDITIENLLEVNFKPLAKAVSYLLTNEHGLSILQHIYDYIHSDKTNISYQGKQITEDIVVCNIYTENEYKLSPSQYDAILLNQIQQELAFKKNDSKK